MKQLKAVGAGLFAGATEYVKATPLVSALIEGAKGYRACLEEQQQEEFIAKLKGKVSDFEEIFSDAWFSSKNGKVICQKIICYGLDPSLSEKTDFFVNSLINSKMDINYARKLKFIEILKQVSLPALLVLAAADEICRDNQNPQNVRNLNLGEKLKDQISLTLIDSCLNELYSYGVLSSNAYRKNTMNKQDVIVGTSTDAAFYTYLTRDFVDFIKEPKITEKDK